MLDTIKKMREEKGEDGFTLAELLIVVAIVLVLVAIAIPVFTGALDKANEATAKADIRAVQGAASTQYLLKDSATKLPVYYSAKIDSSGNVTDLKLDTTATAVTDVEAVKTAVSGNKYPITITVQVKDVESITPASSGD